MNKIGTKAWRRTHTRKNDKRQLQIISAFLTLQIKDNEWEKETESHESMNQNLIIYALQLQFHIEHSLECIVANWFYNFTWTSCGFFFLSLFRKPNFTSFSMQWNDPFFSLCRIKSDCLSWIDITMNCVVILFKTFKAIDFYLKFRWIVKKSS